MDIISTGQTYPERVTKSIFLAGPTPRTAEVASWRPDALRALEDAGYDGTVFVPEFAPGEGPIEYAEQVEWERVTMQRADCILFWVPRDCSPAADGRAKMPGLTTNIEFGRWEASGKIVLGFPEDAEHTAYLAAHAYRLRVPTAHTLTDTIAAAMAHVGSGAERVEGEATVPLHVWRTPQFQRWYDRQRGAGNALLRAEVAWVRRAGPQRRHLFAWGLDVTLWIAAESREKHEMIVGRPDVVAVVLWYETSFRHPERTRVILVREARPATATVDGYVHELPGGSSWDPAEDPKTVAMEEVREETGLVLDSARLYPISARQVAPTILTHHVHAFRYGLTEKEVGQLTAAEDAQTPLGDAAASERTFVEIRTMKEILEHELVGWADLGIIMSAVT